MKLRPQSTFRDHRPTLCLPERHEEEFLHLYELGLFEVRVKSRARGLWFLCLKVGEFFGAYLEAIIGGAKDCIKSSKNVSTYCTKKTILDVIEDTQKLTWQRPCPPRTHRENWVIIVSMLSSGTSSEREIVYLKGWVWTGLCKWVGCQ